MRIYPDIRTVRRFDLLARRNRLSEMGLKLWRLKGREGEFERLREYRVGDEIRHIDWRATSKHRKLISREFTTERNQNIVILLDCGRSMLNETDGISHLDRGLNASIAEGLAIEGEQFARMVPTHDNREALDAWISRRVPNYSGR